MRGPGHHFAATVNITHAHTEHPKVAIKNNGLWLHVAMAIEARKRKAGSVAATNGEGTPTVLGSSQIYPQILILDAQKNKTADRK